tara:strand:+ start:884 stop:2635 length:1752 start_codon:yes stop_codon:yes gene_type:complete
MKWIGQQIYDQVSRFRHDFYLEGITTSTETDMLVVDSSGKVSKRAIDAITVDVSDFLTDGADNRVVTANGTDALLAETYLLFGSDGGDSRLQVISSEDTNDYFDIVTTTSGATTLTTVDSGATAAHFEIAADGDITLDAAGDIALVATGNDISVDTDNFVITSAADQKPFLELKNTNSNTKGSALQFTKDKGAAGADGDIIGIINFVGDDAAQTQTFFTQIKAQVSEADDTDEAGKLTISVANDGTLRNGITMEGSKATAAEVDVTIANGAASTTTIAGNLTVAGTLVSFGGSNANIEMNAGSDIILEADNAGGSNASSIQYLDAGGTNRLMLSANSDVVQLCNRASNGTVTIKANTSTAGGGGEVTAATFTDTETTIAGTLTMGSTPALTNTGLVAVANQSNVTGLGTVSSGVWQGTAIATDQQKHLANFEFEGFSVGDGTNYMIPEINSDTKAPFEHQTSTGSDGLTATAVIRLLRTSGHVMPYAGTLKLWKGWATSSGSSQTVDIGIYKATLVNNDADAVSPVVLKNTSFTSVGNTKALTFSETSFSVAFAAGDILISAIRNGTNAKKCEFTSMLVVEWD